MISSLSSVLPRRWSTYTHLLQALLVLVPIAMVAGLLASKATNHWQYWHIFAEEDGPTEWLTAIVYLIASPIALLLAVRFWRSGLKLHAALATILGLGLLLIGMEEISWGQRLFGLTTPEFLAENNRQQEMNLHNIGNDPIWLDLAFLAVSFYAMTAFHWAPPLLRSLARGRFASIAQLVAPPPFLTLFFAPVFLLFTYYVTSPWLVALFGEHWGYAYVPDRGRFMLSRDQEPVECIMGIGFLLFVIWLTLLERAGVWRDADANHA